MKNALAREARTAQRRAAKITTSAAEDEDEDGENAGAKSGKKAAEEGDEDEPEAGKPGKAGKKATEEEEDEDGENAGAKSGKSARAAARGRDASARERDRCAGLAGLSAQADKLGVDFNVQEAIAKGMSVTAARAAILDAAADGDAGETTAIAPANSRRPVQGSADPEAKKAMWKKALKRR